MWPAILTVLALATGTYVFLARSGYLAELDFLTVYRSELMKSSSHAAALQAALRELARRAPFDALSEAEIEHAGQTLAAVWNPRALARIVRQLYRARDARPLASEDFLRGVVFTYGRLLG